MANETNRLVHLHHINPDAAKAEFLAALRKAKGIKGEAAKAFGVVASALSRWMDRFGWADDAEKLIEELKASGEFPGKKVTGTRPWEVVDRSGKRLGTYATRAAADERAGQTRGARVQPRKLTPQDQKRGEAIAANARRYNAEKRAPAAKRPRRAA